MLTSQTTHKEHVGQYPRVLIYKQNSVERLKWDQ